MKTKQENMRAELGAAQENGRNMAQEKETVSQFLVIDKKTERAVVTARCYMARGSSAMTVYASLWVSNTSAGFYTSGRGSAGGSGYDKQSAAIDDAIKSAGIELYGTPSRFPDAKPDFKKRAFIDGVGSSAIESALLAIAYAAGCRDAIFVSC